MFGFTRILDSESDAKAASKKDQSHLWETVVTVVVMVSLFALAIGIRVWIFAPRFFH